MRVRSAPTAPRTFRTSKWAKNSGSSRENGASPPASCGPLGFSSQTERPFVGVGLPALVASCQAVRDLPIPLPYCELLVRCRRNLGVFV